MFRMTRLASAIAAASITAIPAYAQTNNELEPVIVTATRTAFVDSDAPYASEVYTAEDIKKSGVTSIYDFLNRQTSIIAMPSSGNPYTQKLDMRGFGITDGYQNIVITVDGRRLNNIDMVPQLLSSIPVRSIERIEITKGSGSVRFGDGAMAGTIQIHTKELEGAELMALAGNFGIRNTTISAGLNEERFHLSFAGEHYSQDGFSDADSTGHKDHSRNNTGELKLKFFPSERFDLEIARGSSDIDVRYPGWLSQTAFDVDPAQARSGSTYTHQGFETDWWNTGLNINLDDSLSLEARHNQEDKDSFYVGSAPTKYDYTSNKAEVTYKTGSGEIIAGIEHFDGSRTETGSFANKTSKENLGWYLLGNHKVNQTTYSAGLRQEEVNYIYAPTSGSRLESGHDLTGWELGINHRLNEETSVFANYNDGYQAPDIDRFFKWNSGYTGLEFNSFINPAETKTINLGVNWETPNRKTKTVVFYSDLKNEIYLCKANAGTSCGAFGDNRNIDDSHKYGIDAQIWQQLNNELSGTLNYTWTRAIIDSADSGNIQDKELPGVSRHNLTVALDYEPMENHRLGLTHTWRSKAYSMEDFNNAFSQKQRAFQYTSAKYTYSHTKDLDIFVNVDNVFEKENGLWLRDDVVYPSQFTRNWQVGLNAKF
jgi:iron complex outermembrane receptor protein